MKRKLIAFMAAVLVLLSVFPMSASALVTKPSVVINALCELPEIMVTLPSNGQVYINPYKLPVKIDGESVTEQIVSTPASIENGSDVPLKVDVTIIGTINEDSDMGLVSVSTVDSGSTAKRAFIYFEMQAASDPDQVAWDNEYDMDKHLVVRTTSKTKKQIVTLEQADKPNHYGAFRLTGDCVSAPKSAWEKTDGIEVEIAFTFTPLPRDNS